MPVTRLIALLCLFTVVHWPTMARGEDERESTQLTLHVDLLRAQLRLLELDAHARTLDAIEDALVARATAQLALVQLSALPVLPAYEPQPRWGRGAWFALGVAVGAATGALIGAAWALGR